MMKIMKKIRIHNKDFEVYISAGQIQDRLNKLALQLQQDLQNKEVIFLGILNGAFIFAADLIRKIDMDCQVSFVKVASYHGEQSTGHVEELIGIGEDFTGKCVVIVEDIVDSGLSMDRVVEMVREKNPVEIRIVSMLFKEESFRGTNKPGYIGFVIPNRFVIGYGLDFNGFGRNYDSVYIMT